MKGGERGVIKELIEIRMMKQESKELEKRVVELERAQLGEKTLVDYFEDEKRSREKLFKILERLKKEVLKVRKEGAW